jgi:hypothetical protein
VRTGGGPPGAVVPILCEARHHRTPRPRETGATYTKKTVHEIEAGPGYVNQR